MWVTDISNVSATISYSTYQGCNNFPPDIKVQLILVNENTCDTILIDSKNYVTNHTDSLNPPFLYGSIVYNYTLQVFVGADIDSGMKIGEIGQFMTSDIGDMGGDTCKKTCAFWSAFFPIKSCCYFFSYSDYFYFFIINTFRYDIASWRL